MSKRKKEFDVSELMYPIDPDTGHEDIFKNGWFIYLFENNELTFGVLYDGKPLTHAVTSLTIDWDTEKLLLSLLDGPELWGHINTTRVDWGCLYATHWQDELKRVAKKIKKTKPAETEEQPGLIKFALY